MLSVNFNKTVLVSQNNLNIATNALSKSLERMSTGFRVNSAADDAAGLYIATGLNTQIRGLKQAQNNIANGLSILHTAEGSLGNMTNLLMRMRDLAVQGANGIYDADGLGAIQKEGNALVAEMFRAKDSTLFNGMKIFGEELGITAFSTPPPLRIPLVA